MPKEVQDHQLDSKEREGALWAKALDNLVAITPGSNYYHPHNGTFRLTFTLRRPALLEGLARLEKTLDLPSWDPSSFDNAEEYHLERRDHLESPSHAKDEKIDANLHLHFQDLSLARPTAIIYSENITATEPSQGQPCAC